MEGLKEIIDLGLTEKDYTQVKKRGISTGKLQEQLNIFKEGNTKINLKKPAILNDGIVQLPDESVKEYADYFDSKKDNFKLTKFIPASGAATRMFKFLNEFIVNYNPEKETVKEYITKNNDTALATFLDNHDKFPFSKAIIDTLKQNPDYKKWDKSNFAHHFIKTMLQDEKFDYANKPKGILPFHEYKSCTATPVREHFKESVAYAASQNKTNVHFTISEEHLDGFNEAFNEAKTSIEEKSGTTIDTSISYQHKKTDTIAVDMNNVPFRDNTGNILFRPGGHGALIENLNNLDTDIVFIKNIDNVSHIEQPTITLYKKALGGILIKLQKKVYAHLEEIEKGTITEEQLDEMLCFAKNKLLQHIPESVRSFSKDEKIEYTKQLFNRPIRVCGMVKNEGEPGGGPFWVEDKNGKVSLQIVESSQIDMKDEAQKEIFSQSTHFNPVDLVCGLKNYKGEPFDLNEYIDNTTGFIVTKNRFGTDVKSYELPGLWNGAMAGWITVFAEVPLLTFNPVKNVNDLLKPAHQPS